MGHLRRRGLVVVESWAGRRGLFFWSAAAGVLAVFIASCGAVLAFWLSSGGWIGEPAGRDPKAAADAIRIGLTTAAGAGASVALVVAFRRQRLLEEDREGKRTEALAQAAADRETERAMHERYQAATAQLGHDNLTIRLAGVYALAAVADDWLARADRGQVQVCVDVLCSYLRTGALEDDGSHLDVEVRQTITRVIAAHLQTDAPRSWSGLDFDFVGATFTGTHNFGGAVFSGGDVVFRRAAFSDARVSFSRAVFSGAHVNFTHAVVDDGATLNFTGAEFSGGRVSFASMTLRGAMSFVGARFTGAKVNFIGSVVLSGAVRFLRARFIEGRVSFDSTTYLGGEVSLDDAKFEGGRVSFGASMFGPIEPKDGGGVVTGPWPGPPMPLPKVYPSPAVKGQE